MKSSSGIAVGVILMVVVLVAAIASALSAGMGSNMTVTNRERSRIGASSLITQANDLVSAISGNTLYAKSLPILLDDDAAGCTAIPPTDYCLYSYEQGRFTEPAVSEQLVTTVDANNDLGVWLYKDDGTDKMVALRGVTLDICKQLNALLAGLDYNDAGNPPVGDASFFPADVAQDVDATFTSAGGCYSTAGAEPYNFGVFVP